MCVFCTCTTPKYYKDIGFSLVLYTTHLDRNCLANLVYTQFVLIYNNTCKYYFDGFKYPCYMVIVHRLDLLKFGKITDILYVLLLIAKV